MIKKNNIFQVSNENKEKLKYEEVFECIFKQESFKNQKLLIERIVSMGHKTPEGEWYDQEQDEWVLLISGTSKLSILLPSSELSSSLKSSSSSSSSPKLSSNKLLDPEEKISPKKSPINEEKMTNFAMEQIISLESGDYIFIPKHVKHKVIETSTNPQCIWLAIHMYSNNSTKESINEE